MKSLPIEIFSLIQQYLNVNDYRNFMNCDQDFFSLIKYETIRFSMYISFDNMNTADRKFIEAKLRKLEILMSKVKDRTKQINLSIKLATSEFLTKYFYRFANIHSFFVSGIRSSFPENFNFHIFNNIYHVYLFNVSGITKIMSGFLNVREIMFSYLHDLTTVNLPNITPQTLNLSACRLSSLPMIPCQNLILNELPLSSPIQLVPNNPYRSMTILECGLVSMRIFDNCDLSHLEELNMNELYVDDRDLTIFAHIHSLSISAITTESPPSFSFFKGKFLDLSHCDLRSWISTDSLPNVKEISLRRCINLTQSFSALINIEVISLDDLNISGIDTLPTLLSCRKLTLLSLPWLTYIALQPNLTNLYVYACSHFRAYLLDGQLLKKVSIVDCPNFENGRSFRNTCEFEYVARALAGRLSLSGYDQSEIPSSKRVVKLVSAETFPSFFDCSGLANLHFLTISSFEYLNVAGIHHIDFISLDPCPKLQSVAEIKNIKVLQLGNVPELKSLNGLENIGTIVLINYRGKLDGLGACKQVFCQCCPELEAKARLYINQKRGHIPLPSNEIQRMIIVDALTEFDTVEGFCIVFPNFHLTVTALPANKFVRLW